MGKKLTQEVTADGQTAAKAVNAYEYDDLNRLKTKKYGDLAETTAYTLQGWLNNITSDKFTQSLSYGFNGNIATVNWQHTGKPAAAYNLAYDAQNRLTAATGNAFEEKGISYDRNGNILSLQRTANNAAKDNITYNYSGNQLTSVAGNLASAYTYDNNGNLKTDSRKSLEFSYNYLNLLQSAGETNYTYAADGTKLSVKNGANGFDYLGSLILSANSTEFQFGEGIITKTTGGYDVTYHLRDHLGSVRSVVNKNGDILQQSDYYPFGLKQERADYVNSSNRFLYNGKELQTTGNLGVMDYGARMYNPELGRMNTLDRFLEKAINLSPYQYAGNNPILNVDVNGDSISVANLNVESLINIIIDLNQISGLTVTVENGMLHAVKDDTNSEFSSTAQEMLFSAISSTEGVVNVEDGSDGSKHHKGVIYIDPKQIDKFIAGTSKDIDSRTMGYGMTFLHELGHAKLGGNRRDYYENPKERFNASHTGPNVDFMNIIRKELGTKFAQRISYPIINGYLPFSVQSLNNLTDGIVPTKSYVKTR